MSDPSSERGFRVVALYHPSLHVPDLDEAEAFFARVFGRASTRLQTLSKRPPSDGFADDYATFTPVADVLMDAIDPVRYLVAGRRPYAPVERAVLRGLGWYVDGVDACFRTLRAHGYAVVDQLGEPATGDDPPSAAGAPMPLFFTSPDDAGLRHELLPPIPFPLDHRRVAGWTPGRVDPADPLGIVRGAHHTIRTDDPDRAVHLLVDVLGGSVCHQGRDDLLEADATFVHLADSVLELAAPDGGGVGPHDHYASIAWQVADLRAAEAHLARCGVRVAARGPGDLLTDPATGLGVAWRFTDRPVPGDPR